MARATPIMSLPVMCIKSQQTRVYPSRKNQNPSNPHVSKDFIANIETLLLLLFLLRRVPTISVLLVEEHTAVMEPVEEPERSLVLLNSRRSSVILWKLRDAVREKLRRIGPCLAWDKWLLMSSPTYVSRSSRCCCFCCGCCGCCCRSRCCCCCCRRRVNLWLASQDPIWIVDEEEVTDGKETSTL